MKSERLNVIIGGGKAVTSVISFPLSVFIIEAVIAS
jgi:hypothetical protein